MPAGVRSLYMRAVWKGYSSCSCLQGDPLAGAFVGGPFGIGRSQATVALQAAHFLNFQGLCGAARAHLQNHDVASEFHGDLLLCSCCLCVWDCPSKSRCTN